MNSLQASSSRWDARLWGALIVLCGVVFLDALDVSMVGVALPSIRADLGLSTASLQWVVSGYVLGYGGLLLLRGGRRPPPGPRPAVRLPRRPAAGLPPRAPRSSPRRAHASHRPRGH